VVLSFTGGLLSRVGFFGGAWLGVRAVSSEINMWLGSLGGRAFLGVGFYEKNLDFYVETDAGGSSRGFYDLKIAHGFATL